MITKKSGTKRREKARTKPAIRQRLARSAIIRITGMITVPIENERSIFFVGAGLAGGLVEDDHGVGDCQQHGARGRPTII